jgi:hypothetical protein
MTTPETLEREHTLLTAAARVNDLRLREALAEGDAPGLSRDEAIELLALSEALVRKLAYGRQLTVRTARAAGASWTQIGAALGTTKQSAWETHTRWLADQVNSDRDESSPVE